MVLHCVFEVGSGVGVRKHCCPCSRRAGPALGDAAEFYRHMAKTKAVSQG